MIKRLSQPTAPAAVSSRCRLSLARVLLTASVLVYLFPAPLPAAEDNFPEEQFVKYDQDGVSVAFNNLRAADAAQWMRSTTGVAITLPTSAQTKMINLKLRGAQVDYAVHSLLTALHLNNAFSVYDPEGRLTGVIALDKSVSRPAAENKSLEEEKKTAKDLSSLERESLVKDFVRWSELPAEEQKAIQQRIKEIPPSKDREELIKDYLRFVLGAAEPIATATQ